MHRKRTFIRLRVDTVQRGFQFLARRETLPGVVSFGPPATAGERVFGGVVDIVEALMNEFDTFVEGGFVVPVEIGKMDLEPAKTASAERLGFAEEEEATGKIVSNMIQVRRKGVCTATEVQIVGEVESVTDELALTKVYMSDSNRDESNSNHLQHEQSRSCS